jgi:hypothetical protein
MTTKRKGLILLLLVLVLAAVVALAAGLPRLRFNEGQVFTLPPEAEQLAEQIEDDQAQSVGILTLRAVMLVLLVGYLAYILVSLLTKHGRRRVVNELIRIGIILLFLALVNQRSEEILEPPVDSTEAPEVAVELPLPSSGALETTIIEPDLPTWAPAGVLVVGALLLAGLAGAAVWWWFGPHQRAEAQAEEAQLQIAKQAGLAAQQIEAGQEVQDVILRTYYRMEKILKEERGLERPRNMTPAEFAESLGRYGLPRGAITDLTNLFEAVRYGSQQLGPELEQRALNAFRAIAMTINLEPTHKQPRLGT